MRWHRIAALLMFAAAPPVLAQAPVTTVVTQSRFTPDTPIETIAADPAGKAVLEAVFPDMLTHPEYPNFKGMSLSQVQPLAGGAITDDMIARAKTELAKVK
jgi:hypothetical protein